MPADQDTEITLGTGKMLVLFFGLVALCGVFFGLGFSMGRSAGKPVAASEPTSPATASRVATPRSNSAEKPGDLTFYKTVEQKDANPQLTPADATSTTGSSSAPASATAQSTPNSSGPPDPTNLPGAGSYYVQVAAVSKQEDAEALVDALKKKQYPALTANGTGDKLFHVQVGPYGDIKDAEAMRAKLIADGYNPILKK